MTKTRKRKIKSIIATIIADTLIMIVIFIKCLIPVTILILTVVSTNLTYEEFRQAMAIISISGAIIAVIKLLRENERGE